MHSISQPFAAKNGSVPLIIQDDSLGLSAAFALMGTKAEDKVAIRVTGGCKGMSDDDKQSMINYFTDAMAGFKGVIFSGATRSIKNGVVDPMVTDVPGVVSEVNKGCIALGTAPRTAIMSLQGESRLVLDEWGTAPNPAMDGIMIVQSGPDAAMDWDGDLSKYFSLMEYWKSFAGFRKLGVISWNGGLVTEKEIQGSMKREWVTILVEGTGRVTDEVIAKVQSGEISSKNVFIVSKDRPEELRVVLIEEGFIND